MSNQIEPSVGRIVMFHSDAKQNGSNVHPAIITRVWTRDCVNLTIFPDAGLPYSVTSVSYGENGDGPCVFSQRWFWPERV